MHCGERTRRCPTLPLLRHSSPKLPPCKNVRHMQEQRESSNARDSDSYYSSSSESLIPGLSPTSPDRTDPSSPTLETRGHGFRFALSKVGTGVVRSIWKKSDASNSGSSNPISVPEHDAPRPHKIADEIRHLCGHEKTTIFQRHKDGGDAERVSYSERKILRKMCVKLLECCLR